MLPEWSMRSQESGLKPASNSQAALKPTSAARESRNGLSLDRPTSSGAFVCVERAFLYVAAMMLLATAMLKITGAAGHSELIQRRDPVLIFLTNRQLLILAAMLELATCACFLRSHWSGRLLPLLSPSAIFLVYKLGRGWLHVPTARCPCMGFVGEDLSTGRIGTNAIANGMLAFMLIGSFALVLWAALGERAARSSSTLWSTLRALGRKAGRLGAISLALAAPARAWGASYEVSGFVEQDYFKPDGSAGLVTNWFRIAVSGHRSTIRTGGMTDAAVEFFEYLVQRIHVQLAH